MSMDTINKGRQLIKFYIDTMIDDRIAEVKQNALSANPMVDPDFVLSSIDSIVNRTKECLADKVNYTCLLLIDFIVEGRFRDLEQFDVLFADLLERQLLRKKDFDKLMQELQSKIKQESKIQGNS